MKQQTLMMIKPDATRRNLIGRILMRIEQAGLRIRNMRMIHLTPGQARAFYHVHEGKPFLQDLVAYMSSAPMVAVVLEGEDAIRSLRNLAGATDPAKADAGTIRSEMGLNIQENSVHASDSEESARVEIEFFGLDTAWSQS
ncbi:MAG: nucleoside-diphosphate kinase [Candidatus Eisenbacteria bacterium]|nr:nucleoside-diphosphate kinase [Candidatus Eisenbacteria bacterium]